MKQFALMLGFAWFIGLNFTACGRDSSYDKQPQQARDINPSDTSNASEVSSAPPNTQVKDKDEAETKQDPDTPVASDAEAIADNTANGQSAVSCSFAVNGKTYTGDSEEECAKLREDLGIDDLLGDFFQ